MDFLEASAELNEAGCGISRMNVGRAWKCGVGGRPRTLSGACSRGTTWVAHTAPGRYYYTTVYDVRDVSVYYGFTDYPFRYVEISY